MKIKRLIAGGIGGFLAFILYSAQVWTLLEPNTFATLNVTTMVILLGLLFGDATLVIYAVLGGKKKRSKPSEIDKVKSAQAAGIAPQMPLETAQKLGLAPMPSNQPVPVNPVPNSLEMTQIEFIPIEKSEAPQAKSPQFAQAGIICPKCGSQWREDELYILQIPKGEITYIQYICPNRKKKACLTPIGMAVKLNVAFTPNPNVVARLEREFMEQQK